MMKLSIFDPTGNITALVESPVDEARQSAVAAALMARHPSVEQVGFVTLSDVPLSLRMAGGEFCGNAAMSAAALSLLRQKVPCGEKRELPVRVSGAGECVTVSLSRESESCFAASIAMPRPREITQIRFGGAALELVRMEGISHVIIREDSTLFPLLQNRPQAERAAAELCARLGTDGLGLLFLEGGAPQARMTPLVYVPGSGTLFWENACASGSAAVGMLLSSREAAPVALSLVQPGGILRVESSAGGKTRLHGYTRFLTTYEL